MKYLGIAIVGLLAAGALAFAAHAGTSDRLYAPSEVQAMIAHDSAHWLGQTIEVRGVVRGGCPPGAMCVSPWRVVPRGRGGIVQPAPHTLSVPLSIAYYPFYQSVVTLADTPSSQSGFLPLAFGGSDLILSFLRRLPLLGPVMPHPQMLHWGAQPFTYRVRLQRAPSYLCAQSSCYEAVLLDASPSWTRIVPVWHGPAPVPARPLQVTQPRAIP